MSRLETPTVKGKLTPRQAAERAGVSVKTIRSYVTRGWLPALRRGPPPNGRLFIDPADLEALTAPVEPAGLSADQARRRREYEQARARLRADGLME